MNYELGNWLKKKRAVVSLIAASLLLLGISCRSQYGSVNVNTNAVKGGAINAAKGATKEAAIAAAKTVYVKVEADGTDFSNGPCISNNLMPDWVADVAHNPRQAVDDLPENQCSAYRQGTAHHFVELDPEGQLIRAL